MLAALSLLLRMDLVEANVQKVVLVLCYTPIALALFSVEGKVHLVAGLTIAAGQAIGGWIGASLNLRRGAPLIRAVLAVVLVLAAIKLLMAPVVVQP